jgi:predicted nicotinamide N-methyase
MPSRYFHVGLWPLQRYLVGFFVSAEVFLVGVFLGFRSLFTHTRVVPSVKAPAERRTNFFCFFFALPDSTRASAYMSNRERNRIIDEALAAPPPPPEKCALRTLSFARDVKLRIPAADCIRSLHIRQAHQIALQRADGEDYHAVLQAEFSRLQDEQPWYWDQLWPGGIALARHLLDEPSLVCGRTVLEFGAGIGLLACVAARAGASSVAATDIEPTALEFIRQSAADNGFPPHLVHAVRWDWDQPPPLAVLDVAGPSGLFDVVLLPDVMYDDAAVERLGELAPSLIAPGGLLLWADGTDRPYGEAHSDRLTETLIHAGLTVRSCSEMRAGASTADGGAAPDRPVRLVIADKRAQTTEGATVTHAGAAGRPAGVAQACGLLSLRRSLQDGRTAWVFTQQ